MYVEDFWELGRVAAGLNPVPSVIIDITSSQAARGVLFICSLGNLELLHTEHLHNF